MLSEVIVTSPHKDVTLLIKELAKDVNVNLTVLETSFEDAVSVVKGVIFQNPERFWVVVSGGVTQELLREGISSVPLVSIEPTEYDILLALDQARFSGEEIALFLGGFRQLHTIEKLNSVLGLTLRIYVYNNWRELEVQVEKARQEGIKVIVGVGEKIGALVRQEGIGYVSVLAGKSTLRTALERAKDIIDAEVREKVNAERVNAITSYSHEGIISVNEGNIITVFNPVASKIFALSDAQVVGRSINELSFCPPLAEIFEGAEKKLGFLQQVRDKNVLVNKVPVVDRFHSRGILVTLKEINKVHKEDKISREITTKGLIAKYCFDDIIHVDINMASVVAKARKYANTDCTVLIRGESGTGKELFAQSLHKDGLRGKKPFVAINCASLDDNLLRTELFGYSEGSFTGAIKGGKPGLFELANGGTLFLDEIGKMKLDLQANLLRVLQEKEVRRIGSDRIIPVDVRVIAASNEDLKELVNKGSFREDLYFRLNVLKLTLPSLRERRGDIPDLVEFLLRKISGKYGKNIYCLSPLVLKNLSNMNWPGNVRQLEHFLERCVVLADNDEEVPSIVMEVLEEEFGLKGQAETKFDSIENSISIPIGTLAEMNSELVRKVRTLVNVSHSELALKLGISRPTLLKLLNSHKDANLQKIE